jgi:hypothetical protein
LAMEKMVKGSILLDLVKIIRGTRDERLLSYFSEEQKKIFSEKIIPSGWYPVTVHQRALQAIFEVFGNKNVRLAQEWGKTFGDRIISRSYKSLINPDDPAGSLRNFSRASRTFFNFDYLEIISTEGKKVVFKILFENNPGSLPFLYILGGWLERVVELSGGLNPKVEVSVPRLGTDRAAGFVITWD